MLLHIAAQSRDFVFSLTLPLSVLLIFLVGGTALGQDAVCQNCGTYQSPTAVPGGPYVSLSARTSH